MAKLETVAIINTEELIEIVTQSEHAENRLNEIRHIIENEHSSRAYELIARLLFVHETYEERFDRELEERRAEKAAFKTMSVPEYMNDAIKDDGQQEKS